MGRTWANFSQPLSDDQLLFAALNRSCHSHVIMNVSSCLHVMEQEKNSATVQQRSPSEAHLQVVFVVIVRLLEVGSAVLVSGKPPYPSNLASKLTHVFVDKALEDDVQALQTAGVQCLSPDYIPEFILQVS